MAQDDLKSEYVSVLIAKLSKTENVAMVAVLMERIEHYLGSPNGVVPAKPSTSAKPEPLADKRVAKQPRKRRQSTALSPKIARMIEVLREHGGLTLASLAEVLVNIDPPMYEEGVTVDIVKPRLSAMLGGPSKHLFVRPEVLGGKWNAAE